MNLIARVAALVLLSACCPPAAAQAASAEELDAAYVAFDAVAAREQRAIATRERALAAIGEKAAAADAAGAAELRVARSQSAQLHAISAELNSILDAIEAGNLRPQRLLLEKAVLEEWHATLQRVVAHLTENSFRGLESELAALAAAGAIEPGARRFRSYAELSRRITELGNRILAERNAREAEAARLRTRMQAVLARRDAALRALEPPADQVLRTAADWAAAAVELHVQDEALDAARADLDAATQRVIDAFGSQRPPILSTVEASVAGQAIYSASWRPDESAAGSQSERDRLRADLRARQRDLDLDLAELGQIRAAHSEARSAAAERLHEQGKMVSRSADRYRDKRMLAAGTAVGLDVGTTILEIIATGGAATLARKSEELAAEVAARQAARRVAAGTTAEINAELGVQAVRDALLRAARTGEQQLQAAVAQRSADLLAKGMSREVAAATVAKETRALAARLRDAARIERLAAQSQAGLVDPAITFRAMAGASADATPEQLALMLEGALIQEFWPTPGSPGKVDSATATGWAEAVENGLSVAAATARAAPSPSVGPLSRSQALISKARNGITANAPALAVGAITGYFKWRVAQELDGQINAEVAFYEERDAELVVMYGLYRQALEADAKLDRQIAELRGLRAEYAARLAMLDVGTQLRLQPRPELVSVSDRDTLALELGFSTALRSAPRVSVAGAPMSMQRADAQGMRWRGSLPVGQLGGTGAKPLSVAIEGAPPAPASLDRDPRTPAVRFGRNAAWSGFETGADTNHLLPLGVRKDEPEPIADADPFEAGRALVDEGAAMVDAGRHPGAAELVGTWIGTGYVCNGNEPPEVVTIVASGNFLTATKRLGDRCVRTGEITWRGTLKGGRVSGEFHVRRMDGTDAGDWSPTDFEVVSRDEIRGAGVVYRRQ